MSVGRPCKGPMIPKEIRPFRCRIAVCFMGAVLVTGCASDLPAALREAPATTVTPVEVQAGAGSYLGQRVRWGGTIIAVTNLAQRTDVEVLARPLDGSGSPRSDAPAEGRFIAQLSGFVDPVELPTDRSLTIAGRLVDIETRPVGDYPYPYPVVSVDARYLWPEQPPMVDYPWWGPPWFYDPWWGPPFGPWWRPGYYY